MLDFGGGAGIITCLRFYPPTLLRRTATKGPSPSDSPRVFQEDVGTCAAAYHQFFNVS